MSSSNTVSTDGSKHSRHSISLETQVTPLRPRLVFDPVLLLPQSPPEQEHQPKQQSTNTSPHPSSDEVPVHIPSIYPEDPEESLEAEESIDNEDDDITAEELALICRTRRQRGAPLPGSTRVLKRVRVRKSESSSKRRTKKQTLRVQLQKQDRIEEEMAQFRGKGKAKEKEPSKPGRRHFSTDSVPGSRPPSSLRFSESCYNEEDLEDSDPVTLSGNPEAPMEYGLDALTDRTPSYVA